MNLYLLNIHKDLEDADNMRAEYGRLLALYISEAVETGSVSNLQSTRIHELYDLYKSTGTSWKELNDILQTRLTTSIDNISGLRNRYEEVTAQLHDAHTKRRESSDTAAYAKSAGDFHRLNKVALQLSRQLDQESQNLTNDQVFMVNAPLMKREEVDLRDIRVKA